MENLVYREKEMIAGASQTGKEQTIHDWLTVISQGKIEFLHLQILHKIEKEWF